MVIHWNITTNQWVDISGVNNHAIISGSGIEVFDGSDINNEFYLNGEKVVLEHHKQKIFI